ncbi:MAG: glycosyltransferase family 2 protein [Geobacter sp.]|nr:MAG: glycosyltransferase family 2 protein [Geobacter sp.]
MTVRIPRSAGIVVLYHPKLDALQNILSWSEQIDRVYAVDNSEQQDSQFRDLLTGLDNLTYLPQEGNLGVAAALNIGAKRAISEGYEWLLTMDQDSKATSGMVSEMLIAVQPEGLEITGIISPFHATKAGMTPAADKAVEDVLTVMTSGNLLNLNCYMTAGPFLDELFIDFVDNEYCLRLKSMGFRVVRVNTARLEHHLGDITDHSWKGRIVSVSNHPPLRRYYMARNRFYILEKYREIFPDYCKAEMEKFRGEIKGIFLFEKQKLEKLWMTLLGYLDYKRRIVGKYGH